MLAAARALARAGLPPTPHLDLSVGSEPQDKDEVVEVDQAGAADETAVNPAAVKDEVYEDVEMAEEEDVEADDEEEEEAPPLLSIPESLVLPYSLTQTRQYHLTHLLPHIFSHPVIPSYNRPRLRLPPKSTFSSSAPPIPELPLPLDEYHANTGRLEQSIPDDTPDGKTKDKADVPAHEAQCIARVDLSLGPISFPATELWVGRFVHPRATAPRKPVRTKEEKAERDRIRRQQKKIEEETGVKAPIAKPFIPRAPIVRPPGPARPIAGPSRPPSSAGSGALPVRPGIDPALIQRVNAAAAQHPWLSVIIHKAARNSASKEELAKLARIVARLGKGEGIGEGPNFGLPAVRPPPVRPQSSGSTLSPAPQGSIGNSESELSSAPSDGSDSEPDMTGPKQVGGGPMPDPAQSAQAGPSSGPSNTPSAVPNVTSSPTSQPTAAPVFRPHAPASFGSSTLSGGKLPPIPLSRPPQNIASPASTPTQATPRPLPHYPSTAPGASTSSPIPRPSVTPTAPPLPPPRRFPQPAPFLYIAFRELPTEKYLVPIGSQSYFSRVGGDHVTHPAPPTVAKAAPAPVLTPAPPVPMAEPVLPIPNSAPGEISKRTRQSLGKQKEEKPPTPEPVVEQLPTPPPGIPKSSLPPLPGTAPPPGTVLISTFVPSSDWMQPDWKSMSKRLPFENRIYDIVEQKAPVIEAKPEPSSPERRRHLDPKPGRPPMLNLGAEAWYPDDDAVHAVTFRLHGLDDRAWARMKRVITDAEQAEVNILAEQQPELLAPVGRDRASQPRLWETYCAQKRSNFESLLARVPSRTFLHYRLAEKSSDLIDASADRWAPRPYPLSTRPLYLTSPPPEGEEQLWDIPLPAHKKRRNEPEAEVEFEMPVSLDQLDERVAVGAQKAVNRKVGKLKMPKKRPSKPVINDADENAGTRFQKRGVPGRKCQGCAGEGLKVWRRGPGGPGTLCNPCGSKYLDGTLGPLQAPATSEAPPADTSQDSVSDFKMELDPDVPMASTSQSERPKSPMPDPVALPRADPPTTTVPSVPIAPASGSPAASSTRVQADAPVPNAHDQSKQVVAEH